MRFVLALVVFTSSLSIAQNKELDKRNGFKDLKLTSKVSDYDGLEFKKNIEDDYYQEAQLYTAKKGFYETIGNIKIHNLMVQTYNGEIFKIKIIVDKDPKLYKGLKQNFGDPKYDLRRDEYYWSGDLLRLGYTSLSKNKIVMTYSSYLMRKKFKEDKKKEIESIADDF